MALVPECTRSPSDLPAGLSLTEFVDGQRTYQRATGRQVAFFLIGLLVVFVGLFAAAISQPGVLQHSSAHRFWGLLALALFAVCTVGSLIALAVRQERTARRLGLLCPNCSQLLIGIDGQFAIAIRRCRHCQAPMFGSLGEPSSVNKLRPVDDAHDGASELALADFTSADATGKGVLLRWTLIAALAALVVAGVTALVLWAGGLWSASLIPDGPQFALRVLPACTFVVAFGVGFILAFRRSERLGAIECPVCGDVLQNRTVVRLTGNCTSCGCRIIHDAPQECDTDVDSANGLLDPKDFLAGSRKLRRRMPLCCLSGAAAGFVWMAAVMCACRWMGQVADGDIHPLGAVAMSFGLVIQFAVVMWRGRAVERRLRCPSCDRSLLGATQTILATGRCASCGQLVLSLPQRFGRIIRSATNQTEKADESNAPDATSGR